MKKIIIYTDGGSRGNPGKAAIGVFFAMKKDRSARSIPITWGTI
jgi:ribonuclease HI